MPLDDISGDLMLGAEPIARFLTTLFDGEQITATDVYNWNARGDLPLSRLAGKLVGSKTKLRAHLYQPASQPAASAFTLRRR